MFMGRLAVDEFAPEGGDWEPLAGVAMAGVALLRFCPKEKFLKRELMRSIKGTVWGEGEKEKKRRRKKKKKGERGKKRETRARGERM